MYKVLITTSGTGSRLKEITRHTNKALVDIEGKTVIEYILDRYPPEVPIVITLGFLADQVRDFVSQNYPDRQVEYAVVDRFEGPGTSCCYSILQAKEYLQCPFIFHACDTIVFEDIPAPDENWTAGYVNSHIADDVVIQNFRTHLMRDGRLVKVNDLRATDYSYIHIGITAIKDYKEFWKQLSHLYKSDPNLSQLTDIHVINAMIEAGFPFTSIPFKIWLDTGNPNTLAYTKDYIVKNISKI